MVIDSRSLEIKPASEFQTYIKPSSWDKVSQEALDINKIKKEVVDKDGLSLKSAWEAFTAYVNKYNKKKSFWGAPIAAGHNIVGYDMIIVNRLCRLYGPVDAKTKAPILFHGRDKIDSMNLAFLWFENNKELENHKLDTMRKYLGIPLDGAHDARIDVKHTAMIISRFLKFHRNIAAKTKFNGAFKDVK